MGLKIAVVGATGNVGREILNILDERMFPCEEVVALASRKSIGRELSYGDKLLKVKDLETYDFNKAELILGKSKYDESQINEIFRKTKKIRGHLEIFIILYKLIKSIKNKYYKLQNN